MKVSIIGAGGTVGSSTAFAIADQGLAEEIVMLDSKQNLLTNHAMDISTATVFQRDMIVRTGGYTDIAGSDIVIIAAGIHFTLNSSLRERLGPNVSIIQDIARNIQKNAPDAVIITATNPVDLINYAVYLSTSLDRKTLIGYNLNDSTRFRMSLAKALGIQPSRVEGLVVGDHPRAPVMLFSSVKVDGKPVQMDEVARNRVRNEIINYLKSFEALNAGRTAGWTTGAGLARMVRAINEDAQTVFPCSAVMEGEYGYRGISIGVPAVIGRQGISRVVEWELPDDERRDLDAAASVLKQNALIVKEITKSSRT